MNENGHPEAGVDYPETYQDLLAWFPDNQACLDYLAELRWPDGFVCPACKATEFWRTGEDLWMCRDCGAADVGDGGHDLRPDPDPVVDLVRRDLADHLAEERHVRAGSATSPGVQVL